MILLAMTFGQWQLNVLIIVARRRNKVFYTLNLCILKIPAKQSCDLQTSTDQDHFIIAVSIYKFILVCFSYFLLAVHFVPMQENK